MKHKFLKAFLLSILYSSLIFSTAPQYVECEDFFPDEVLDLFAITQNNLPSSNILKHHLSVFWFFNFCGETHSIQRYQSQNLYSQPFTPELIFSVTLRC